MKLEDFRKKTRYKIVKTDYSITDVIKYYHIDTDIHLKISGLKLQRDLVWTEKQKQELIESVVCGKHIPPITAWIDPRENVMKVIDGKQRISTLISFLDDGFLWREVLYSELPEDIQRVIWDFNLVVNRVVNVNYITEKEYLDIFESVNFRGTPQDAQHLETLKSHINGR